MDLLLHDVLFYFHYYYFLPSVVVHLSRGALSTFNHFLTLKSTFI